MLGPRSFVTTAGLTPEPYLPNSGRFLHNASWAYDPSRSSFVISRDTGNLDGNEIQVNVEVDRIAGASIWSGSGTWTVIGQITSAQTGYHWNHNSGLVRDPYGGLATRVPSTTPASMSTSPPNPAAAAPRSPGTATSRTVCSTVRPSSSAAGAGPVSSRGT